MDRKTFFKKTTGVMLIALPVYSLLGCSSSDDSSEPPKQNANANCIANGTAISIGGNHGHSLTVSQGDVQAGTAKTYTIKGTSVHNHSVNLSAADFTALKSNSAISVTSSNDDGHTLSTSFLRIINHEKESLKEPYFDYGSFYVLTLFRYLKNCFKKNDYITIFAL